METTKKENHPPRKRAACQVFTISRIFRIKDECQVYEARPFACRTYPLSNYLLNGKYYIAVNVQCEYGSDIYIAALRELAADRASGAGIPYES